ncbi:MAG: hypothetical protein ACXWKJ_18280 [Telluria sp.]
MSTDFISTLLPPEVRDALIKASRTPGTERERRIAIEKATNLARRTKPSLFKDENHEDQTFECPSFLPRPV